MYTRHSLHWFQLHGENARNWLALGLLLAAWNFSDDAAVSNAGRAGSESSSPPLLTAKTLRDRAGLSAFTTGHRPHGEGRYMIRRFT